MLDESISQSESEGYHMFMWTVNVTVKIPLCLKALQQKFSKAATIFVGKCAFGDLANLHNDLLCHQVSQYVYVDMLTCEHYMSADMLAGPIPATNAHIRTHT